MKTLYIVDNNKKYILVGLLSTPEFFVARPDKNKNRGTKKSKSKKINIYRGKKKLHFGGPALRPTP